MKNLKQWNDVASLEDALEHGLSEAEFQNVTTVLGRSISILELGISAALYSEHCSYKSTKVHLKTLPTTGERVIQGPGENAGVVDIGDGQAVAFKIESHNHPSFIEPFQGAATGVGGILRDIFTMGARPIALLNSLRFGAPENERTGYLVSRAVKGIGSYGNCMGIPTVGGELFFHESFNGNCLVNAFALGLVDQDKIFKGNASGVGNPVIYVGAKTGRDGIRGANMASESFNDDSEEKRPTVQVGDPFLEKLLLEACIEAMHSGLVVGIQDMGAAGLTSSTYEMAARAGTGIRLDLDKVPQREEGMNPYELMLSESQERMLLVAKKGRERDVIAIFTRWELAASVVGEVVEGTDVTLCWHGEEVSVIPAQVLTDSVPMCRWPEKEPDDYKARLEFPVDSIPEPENLSEIWKNLLGSVNCCSRAPLYSQYDSTIGASTVVHPGGDAAVVRVRTPKKRSGSKEKGIAITLDCNSRYCSVDPRLGSALSIAEACRNIAAVGATPIGISDNLNFGAPDKPDGMWQIAESVRGIGEAARAFEIPVVSGNVSLYNETKGKGIYPTPEIAMVGLIGDVSLSVGSHFTTAGDKILVFGDTRDTDLGSTEYMAVFAGVEKGAPPSLHYDLELRTCNLIRDLIGQKLLRSCHDLSGGGLAIALAECCMSDYGSLGGVIEVEDYKGRKDGLLFAETGARFIVSCSPQSETKIRKAAEKAGIKVTLSGVVGGTQIAIKGYAALDLEEARAVWRDGLKRFF